MSLKKMNAQRAAMTMTLFIFLSCNIAEKANKQSTSIEGAQSISDVEAQTEGARKERLHRRVVLHLLLNLETSFLSEGEKDNFDELIRRLENFRSEKRQICSRDEELLFEVEKEISEKVDNGINESAIKEVVKTVLQSYREELESEEVHFHNCVKENRDALKEISEQERVVIEACLNAPAEDLLAERREIPRRLHPLAQFFFHKILGRTHSLDEEQKITFAEKLLSDQCLEVLNE